MTRFQKWFVLICLMIGSGLGVLIAQQQYSGGQSVTISNASLAVTESGAPWSQNVTQFGGTNITTGTGASGSGIPRVTVSNDSTMGLVAGTALVGKTYPYTGCGTTQVESGSPVGFAAMPTSATSIESATTCVLTLVVTNTGSASATYYFTDAQSTAVSVIGSSANPVTILAGERDEYSFPNGAKFNSGIKVAASASGLSYYLLGIQ